MTVGGASGRGSGSGSGAGSRVEPSEPAPPSPPPDASMGALEGGADSVPAGAGAKAIDPDREGEGDRRGDDPDDAAR